LPVRPYYEDGQVTIYHGDCREILPLLPSVDLVLTDPPYNAGKRYGAHDDAMSREQYEAWCASWFIPVRQLAKRIVVFPGHGNVDLWYRIERPSAIGCWYKPGNARSSIIGWEEWEPWLYWTGDCGLLGGSSVITAAVGKQSDTGDHPCPKPTLLMAKLLGKCRATSVCDPFMGSGTTLVAAKRNGIRAVGIEIEERYCEIAAERLRQSVLPLEIPVSEPRCLYDAGLGVVA
jgi:site-specific DNA-methyltransferase (adenine-specific)